MTSCLTEGPPFGGRSHKLPVLGRLAVMKPMIRLLLVGVFTECQMLSKIGTPTQAKTYVRCYCSRKTKGSLDAQVVRWVWESYCSQNCLLFIFKPGTSDTTFKALLNTFKGMHLLPNLSHYY